ncbi:MAG TPA: alpha/beta fold hydrolase [Gemmatimonadales bacterium]|jgi:phospholipase/carboxylesterase
MTDLPPLHAMIDPGSSDGPVIVLLHGRGSDERDLHPLGRMLHPDATTVSVRAPFPAAPWGYGPGYAWYRFLGGTTPESESFERGQDALAAFLDEIPSRLGRTGTPIILGGFSQGGTTSLAYLMRHPGAVNAVMVFSGFLADHPSVHVTAERVGTTPIFWGHGTADGAVPFEAAETGWQALRAAGAALESHRYPSMSHTIDEVELRDAATWLDRILAAGTQNGAS